MYKTRLNIDTFWFMVNYIYDVQFTKKSYYHRNSIINQRWGRTCKNMDNAKGGYFRRNYERYDCLLYIYLILFIYKLPKNI